jgi:uncharacterized repeat protein (TIGR02059 family)
MCQFKNQKPDVFVSGTKVLLNLASPVVYGDAVTVAYTKPATNPLQTAIGGQVAPISVQKVTNNVATVNPVYVSSIIENATPSRLDMTYNLTLANIVPAPSSFTVLVNSSAITVNSVAVSGTKVLLTLTSPVVYGDVVTVAYAKPVSDPLQTSAGGQAASIPVQEVTNNCIAQGNQPPVVNISSPIKSTSFFSPATITIDAVATDADGTVSKVEFYQGTVLLGERTLSPYSYTWKDVIEGTYSLTAVATDDKNSKTTSAPVSIIIEKSPTAVNQLPVVNVILPNNKTKKPKRHDDIVIEAIASDPDGTISKVEFKSGDITLAEVTTFPYIYIWEDSETGTYIITAIATDNLGATSASANLEFTVGFLYDGNSEIINLFPNPNDGHFTIDLISGLPENTNRLNIVNLAGKTVFVENLAEEDYTKDFDLPGLSSGTYILIVTNGQNIVTTKKFIKN